MNFEPQTYEELIRMKRCVELTKYYEVTEEELWEIYHFLEQEPEAFIKGGRQNLSLIIGQNTAKTQKDKPQGQKQGNPQAKNNQPSGNSNNNNNNNR